jgi:LDH2 family malate/lactate/ureidoglycolate dehydrogenase
MSFEAAQGEETVGTRPKRAPADRIEEFATAVLIAVGTDPAVARSVAGALTETSDSFVLLHDGVKPFHGTNPANRQLRRQAFHPHR